MRKTIFAVLFFLALPIIVFADTEASPFPYTVETADKKYVFVSVNPKCELCWGSDKYRQSGMYLNNGSTVPLWTVDWQNYIFLPGDGKHVVRKGSWARYSATYREEVFSFVAEGRVLKTYVTADLIDFPYLLPHSSSHYRVINSSFDKDSPHDGVLMKMDYGEGYPLNSGVTIDNENQTILIETLHADKYLFDLKTGNIISSERPAKRTAIGLFGALLFGFAVYLFSMWKINPSDSALKIASCVAGFFLTLFLFLIPVIAVSVNHVTNAGSSDAYPGFRILCLVSVSTFPTYLLTSLNLISGPENNTVPVGYDVILQWFLIFWLPCILLLGFLTHFFVSGFKRLR